MFYQVLKQNVPSVTGRDNEIEHYTIMKTSILQ